MAKIFVYGSLKKGKYNHSMLLSQKFLGESKLPYARLYNMGSYPGIRPSGNKNHIVSGEIYEVDKEVKDRIDSMESGAGYKCVTKEFKLNGETVKADVYYYMGELPEDNWIKSGVW